MRISVKTSGKFICLCTCSNISEAKRISTVLVKEKLAACVNIIKGVSSVYLWMGKIRNDSESLLIIKGCARNREKLAERIKDLHSYKVPEIIFISLDSGSKEYLEWLNKNCI